MYLGITVWHSPRHLPEMKIDASKWYTAREAASHLGVTEESVKKYCRTGTLAGKQKGPKKRWHVLGTAIMKKRKEWGLDEHDN
jgi:Helix-turn-helix domain